MNDIVKNKLSWFILFAMFCFSGPLFSAPNVGDLEVISSAYLKGLDINAENFKKDMVGASGAKFNITKNTSDKVYLVPFISVSESSQSTGYTLDKLPSLYPYRR